MFALLTSLASCILYNKHEEKSFISWMRSTNQFYTGDEYHLRFGIFMTNLRLIKEFNSRDNGFKVGINRFAALTPSEYRSYLNSKPVAINKKPVAAPKRSNEDSFDWRDKGVVGPIKDVAQCAGSWAFAAIAGVESADAISTGNLILLSEQELIDCVKKCEGCDGGNVLLALDYVILKQNGQFVKQDDYKFIGYTGECKFSECTPAGKIGGYDAIKVNDEESMADHVRNRGPINCGMDGSHWGFQLYDHGIFKDPTCDGTTNNFSLVIVGYGVENETPFWIARNCFGTSWGEKGYIRVLRGVNTCGIAAVPFIIVS